MAQWTRGQLAEGVRTYLLGVLVAVVQYKKNLDLFTYSRQRSDTSKVIVSERQSPAPQDAGLWGGPRSIEGGGCEGGGRARKAAE